jgi:hypothetical protein
VLKNLFSRIKTYILSEADTRKRTDYGEPVNSARRKTANKTIDEAVRLLYNRSILLTNLLERRFSLDKDSDLVNLYNTLREDVKNFVDEPGFARSVPVAQDASTVEQLRDKAHILQSYLRDYIAPKYPSFRSYLYPQYKQKLQVKLGRLEARNRALEQKLAETTRQLNRFKEMLAALETPSQFEIPQLVLDKLDPLEQTRILEAVQAYRVNAWTPTAAVCGMILEGRLQKLCKENDIRLGGIADMIRRLGEADLLKGYYQNLAQVGEFFRHRASHPTSEEFDREKTTLVLTSLVILIRDLF